MTAAAVANEPPVTVANAPTTDSVRKIFLAYSQARQYVQAHEYVDYPRADPSAAESIVGSSVVATQVTNETAAEESVEQSRASHIIPVVNNKDQKTRETNNVKSNQLPKKLNLKVKVLHC